MKKIYLGALAVAFAVTATAQSKQGTVSPKVTPQTNDVITINKDGEAYNKLKQRAVWSEDFSNGFAGQGTNGAFTQEGLPTSKGTVPMWEYRGPATTPDVSMGSNGSCGGAAPIQSATASNGFVIFDSNGLDEPLPAMCAGSGSGPAPTPHNSTLYTPSIDLSTQNSVQVFFTTLARNFQASVNIIIIADGDTTTVADVYDVLDLAANAATAADEVVGVDISAAAGGKSDVKIGFNFVGDYYYFMMDDIMIDAVPDYNYSIGDIFNDDITDYYEYLHLPLSQTHVLQPGISAVSQGALPVDLTLSVSITDPNMDVQTFSTTINQVLKDSSTGVQYIDTYEPSIIGTYTMEFKVSSPNDSDDLSISNNIATRTFILTNDLWSDAFATGAASFRAPEVDGAPGESEHFQIHYTYNEVTVYGMDFLIINGATTPDQNTFPGDEVQLSVFNIDEAAFNTALNTAGANTLKSELFTEAASTFFVVADSNISTGTLTPQRVYFDSPVTVPADQLFAISLYNSGGGYLRIPVTNPGTNSDLSGTVRARGLLADPAAVTDDELLFFNNVNPWLRVRTAPNSIGVNDRAQTPSLIGDAVPNPSAGNVNVSYTLLNQANVSLTVSDLSGKVIMSQNEGTKSAGSQKLSFDVSNLNAGVYFYSVNVNGNATTKKLVVTK